MKDYRNANMNFAPQGAGRPSRDARPEWFNRRFAKRLFCLIMAISLLSNTLGFVADDLSFTQNRPASAEILDINLEPNGGDALNSGDLELDIPLADDGSDGLDQIGDLSLTHELASNGAGDENTYVLQLNGETRLLLSDLVKQMNLPVRDMKLVQNVSLLPNELDPTIDMSRFVSIVAVEDDFLICLKPLFAEAKLLVYVQDVVFAIRLLNDPTLPLEDVAKAAQTLSENPSPFDAIFTCDFERQPVNIRLSALLAWAGLPISARNVVNVGAVEHYGDEVQVLDIEKLEGDYQITAKQNFAGIEFAVFTENETYTIALLNGRAADGQAQTEVGLEGCIELSVAIPIVEAHVAAVVAAPLR